MSTPPPAPTGHEPLWGPDPPCLASVLSAFCLPTLIHFLFFSFGLPASLFFPSGSLPSALLFLTMSLSTRLPLAHGCHYHVVPPFSCDWPQSAMCPQAVHPGGRQSRKNGVSQQGFAVGGSEPLYWSQLWASWHRGEAAIVRGNRAGVSSSHLSRVELILQARSC